ncbi:DUF6234 family protein [Streptomyces niger]|uniref:DUF6234 family protein n=1 Tax=Streptomyces niger TaxID=66373 RepID=UPI00069C5D71|nr:DUF6234 family protein [Streptomyces niger]
MDLPIAPPAFDATTGPRKRDRANLGVDIAIGSCLLLLEVMAVVVIVGVWYVSGFNLDPEKTVEYDPLWGYLTAIAAVAAVAIVAALIAARAGALVTVFSQATMAVLITLLAAGGAMMEADHEAAVSTGANPCRHSPSAPWCIG